MTPHPPGAWPDSPIEEKPSTVTSNPTLVDRHIIGQESTLGSSKNQSRQSDSVLSSSSHRTHMQFPNQSLPKEVNFTKREPIPRQLEPPQTGMIVEDGKRVYIPKYAANGHGKSCTGRSATPSSAALRLSSRADHSRGPSARRSSVQRSTNPPPWYDPPERPARDRAATINSTYTARLGLPEYQSPQHRSAAHTTAISQRTSSRTSQGNPLKPPRIPNNSVIKDTYLRAFESMPIIQQTIGEERTSTEPTREAQTFPSAKVNSASYLTCYRESSISCENSRLNRDAAIPTPKVERQSRKPKIFRSIRNWSFRFAKTESNLMMDKAMADNIVKNDREKTYPGSLGGRFARVLRRKGINGVLS